MHDNCIICSKKFGWHEPVITKIPEVVPFCIECSEKYTDEKEYDFEKYWSLMVCYRIRT